jgi:FMN-dependent dehydrogenase
VAFDRLSTGTEMDGDDTAEGQPGRQRQETIYRNGVFGHTPAVPTNFAALEQAAKSKMTRQAWAYVAGGAGEGAGITNNRAALDRWAILPRMLRDCSRRDLTVELFGRRLPAPILVAPVQVTRAAVKTLLSLARNVPGNFVRNLISPLPRASVETFLDTY